MMCVFFIWLPDSYPNFKFNQTLNSTKFNLQMRQKRIFWDDKSDIRFLKK